MTNKQVAWFGIVATGFCLIWGVVWYEESNNTYGDGWAFLGGTCVIEMDAPILELNERYIACQMYHDELKERK